MPNRKTTRIYTRNQGGIIRYYGDFRAYADVGGGREALVPKGQTRATTDPDIAAKLYADRLAELDRLRRNKHLHGIEREATLAGYADRHLRLKARDREATGRWLQSAEKHLQAAVDYFGAEADLASITPEDFTGWVEVLRGRDNGRGGTLSESTVRKYLNSLSNMYARAVSERYVPSNPVGDMYSKPTEERREAPYLEAHEAALFLESARTYRAPVGDGAFPWMYPLVATFLLTGGRKSEVLGLEVDDVSFRFNKIYFRPNDRRRLKTRGSKRAVPLWPQLREILGPYMMERERLGGLGSLLFPSGRGEGERMIRDVRKALDRIAVRAGFAKGSIRLHQLRHTYTAARLQTCDRGRPVAVYTVARELGHRSTSMIEDRYGHLHDRAVAGGSEVVEFRVEGYRDQLGERLTALDGRAAVEEAGTR